MKRVYAVENRGLLQTIADQAELKDDYRGFGFEETETRDFAHLPFRVTFMTNGPGGGRFHPAAIGREPGGGQEARARSGRTLPGKTGPGPSERFNRAHGHAGCRRTSLRAPPRFRRCRQSGG